MGDRSTYPMPWYIEEDPTDPGTAHIFANDGTTIVDGLPLDIDPRIIDQREI